jgi:opacity protein-like surface antigen
MQYKKLRFCVLILLIALPGLSAQEVMPASGGNGTGSGGSASYTIGQPGYTTSSGTNGSVSEGVQQPYEISTITGIEDAVGIVLASSVYPNPATDFLILRVDDYEGMKLSYQLFDINGRLLESNYITGSESAIMMSRYSAGTYFLKVMSSNKDVKTFKIIKN